MGSLEKALKNFRPRVCDQNIHYSLYIILHYDALPAKKGPATWLALPG